MGIGKHAEDEESLTVLGRRPGNDQTGSEKQCATSATAMDEDEGSSK